VAHLFPRIESELVVLLSSLSSAEWQLPTVSPAWSVKDIAAHLLDGNLRRLSMARDGFYAEAPREDEDLAAFINRINAQGVQMLRRLSPRLLIHLLDVTGRETSAYFQSLDAFAPAVWAVSWAGEEQSPNWFDMARDYTEKWHHQQQIRLAANRPGIMERDLYHPVLDAFLRALPHSYRTVQAAQGTTLHVHIRGEAGGDWFLLRREDTWRLRTRAEGPPAARVEMRQEIAWRVFTKGISKNAAAQQMTFEGEQALGRHLLNTLAIIA
jgi:uncharacterized protein (TIGR03083 family)